MSCEASMLHRDLIDKAQRGDKEAAEELIRLHQPLLRAMAGRLWRTYVSCDELVQAGNLGLMRALNHYDPAQETRLSTYAVPWILGEMRRALKCEENSRISLDEPQGEDAWSLHDIIQSSSGVDIGQVDLHLAIEKLDHEDQLLICLRYFRDKTQKETALLLRKSQAQISKMERRALDALHEMLC